MALNEKQRQRALERNLATVTESRYRLNRLMADIGKLKSTAGVSKAEDMIRNHVRKIRDAAGAIETELLDRHAARFDLMFEKEHKEARERREREAAKAAKKAEKLKAKPKKAAKVAAKTAKKAAKMEVKAAKPVAAFPFPADPPVQPTKPATIEPSKPIKPKKAKTPSTKPWPKKNPKPSAKAVKPKKAKFDHDKMANTLDPGSAIGIMAARPSSHDLPMGSLQSDGGAY